jgi:hypothetical protein
LKEIGAVVRSRDRYLSQHCGMTFFFKKKKIFFIIDRAAAPWTKYRPGSFEIKKKKRSTPIS